MQANEEDSSKQELDDEARSWRLPPIVQSSAHPLSSLHVGDERVDGLVRAREEIFGLSPVDLGVELGLEHVVHALGRLDTLMTDFEQGAVKGNAPRTQAGRSRGGEGGLDLRLNGVHDPDGGGNAADEANAALYDLRVESHLVQEKATKQTNCQVRPDRHEGGS